MAAETTTFAKEADSVEIKLFNKWSCDVTIDDMSLQVPFVGSRPTCDCQPSF